MLVKVSDPQPLVVNTPRVSHGWSSEDEAKCRDRPGFSGIAPNWFSQCYLKNEASHPAELVN